jgi:hypothetical protein
LQPCGRILAMASSDPSPGDEREVFAGLPNARPHRRSAKRDRATAAGGAKPKRAAPSRGAAAAKGERRAASTPKASPRAAAREIPPAGYATPTEAAGDGPKGADLFTTAVQAVGELAQIGVAAGGRAVKSALQRLPRP